MSRMLAFDNWALFLLAMETIRYYKGDLVVTHVYCVLKEIMELMKLYEKDGLLRIKHGYQSAKPVNAKFGYF